MDKFYDVFLPPAKCSLLDCTPGKIYAVVGVLSLLTSSATSWQSFVATLTWQFLLGLAMAYLCRSCRSRWAWALLVFLTFVPITLIGIAAIAEGQKANK